MKNLSILTALIITLSGCVSTPSQSMYNGLGELHAYLDACNAKGYINDDLYMRALNASRISQKNWKIDQQQLKRAYYAGKRKWENPTRSRCNSQKRELFQFINKAESSPKAGNQSIQIQQPTYQKNNALCTNAGVMTHCTKY